MNEVLNNLAKQKGFGTLTELAQAMGRNPSTFFNNLRYFSKKKNFNSKFGRDLLNTLNVSESEFVEAIMNEKKTKVSLQKVLDKKASNFSSMQVNEHEEILAIIENLDHGNMYTKITKEIPIEFTNPLFYKIILGAIEKGVHFKFVFPESVVYLVQKGISSYQNEIPIKEQAIKVEIDHFAVCLRKQISIFRPMIDLRMHHRLRDLISSNIKATFTTNPLLYNPIQSYIIINKDNEEGYPYFGLGEIKVGKFYSIRNQEYSLIRYPLTLEHTSFLISELDKIEDENKKIDRKEYSPTK